MMRLTSWDGSDEGDRGDMKQVYPWCFIELAKNEVNEE